MIESAHVNSPLQTLIESHDRFISKHPPRLLDAVPLVPAHDVHTIHGERRLLPDEPAPPLRGVRKRCGHKRRQDPQRLHVLVRAVVLVERVPDCARKVPEVDWLAVRDKERLSRNLKRRLCRTCERVLRELVEATATECARRCRCECGILPSCLDQFGIGGRLDVGPKRACFRRGDAVCTRRERDGRQVFLRNLLHQLRRELFGNILVELVGGEQVRVRDIADVRPVEQVRVVADLPVRLPTLPDIEEASDALSVARAGVCMSVTSQAIK